MRLAILGGTGAEGRGLALRFAVAGHAIVIGSRAAERALAAAGEVAAQVPGASVSGLENRAAAGAGEVVFLAVPYEGLAELLRDLAPAVEGKIVVSTVAPMRFVDGRAAPLALEGGSAGELAQRAAPGTRVVAAFHHVSARLLGRLDRDLDEDVLYCTDDAEAGQRVAALAEQLPGVRAVLAGPLANSGMLESITPLLLNVNRLHKTNAGLRLTGIKPR